MTKTISETVYWLILLLFFPAVLSTLGLDELLRPVQMMLNKVLDFLPNIITAFLILVVGWFKSRTIHKIIVSLFEATGSEKLSEHIGLSSLIGKQKLSNVIGLIIYVLVLIPILIATLNALQLDALTQPASKMPEMIIVALPNISVASLILIIAYIMGRVLSSLVSNLLTGIGFNSILSRLGIGREISFAIGLLLANLLSKAILATSAVQAKLLAVFARVYIIILTAAMGLRQMWGWPMKSSIWHSEYFSGR